MRATDRDQKLLERLNRHPHLRARLESLLAVVEGGVHGSGVNRGREMALLHKLDLGKEGG